MYLGYKQLRSRAKMLVEQTVEATGSADLKAAAQAWIDGYNSADNTREIAEKLAEALKAEGSDSAKKALDYEDFFMSYR